jgi:hypothetical protein
VGDREFSIEAAAFQGVDRTILYQSLALTAELHETERDRVCRALGSIARLGDLSIQALTLKPIGLLNALKEQFERFLSED